MTQIMNFFLNFSDLFTFLAEAGKVIYLLEYYPGGYIFLS